MNRRSDRPFFSIKRERLQRKDGTDTGHDALYRVDNGRQLAVVSRTYQLIKHREAVDFVHHVLDEVGIEKRRTRVELGPNGSRLFYEMQLPEHRFNAPAETGVNNTAHDGTAKRDEYVPRIVVTNSYDGSGPFGLLFGAFRMVCKNGLVIGTRVQELRIRHRFNNIDFEEIREPLVANLENTIEGIRRTYATLNQEDGSQAFGELLTSEGMARKYREMMISRCSPT